MRHPPLGTRVLAHEALGWDDNDRDLTKELWLPDTLVELQMVGTTNYIFDVEDPDLIGDYRVMYGQDGLTALPPIWAWKGGPYPELITGMHRSTAAFQLGHLEIPAWVLVESE